MQSLRMSSVPPGIYRADDGSQVEFWTAIRAWTAAAVQVLERIARIYHGTITYQDLAGQVQDEAGIKTRMLMMNWIGKVLGGVARESHRRGQPLLSALCVHSDGTIGGGYAEAVVENYGGPPPADLEMHAAEERLRCYQFFGASLPAGGGVPALTHQVAARRAWIARQATPAPAADRFCPACNLALPVSGVCDNCS